MTPADAVVDACRLPFVGFTPPVIGYDSIIPLKPSGRWFVVYPDGGTFESLTLCRAGDVGVIRWQVSTFGPTRASAQFVADAIRTRLLGSPIVVAGWMDANADHEISVQARPDEAVREVPLVSCVDRYSMTICKL